MQPTVVIVGDLRLPARDTAAAGPIAGGGAHPHALSVLVVDDEMDGRALREAIAAVDPRLATRVVLVTGDIVSGRVGSPEPHDGPTLQDPFSAGEVSALLDRFAP